MSLSNGFKSSEIILTLLSIAVIIGNKWLHLGLDPSDLYAMVGATGVYAGSRGLAKSAGK